ncbi:hypothetical protein ACWGKU_18420 [Kitasatospora sp. NPDC054768]
MTDADPRGLEAVAQCHLTEVRTIEEEIERFASILGFSADLDRLMLLPGTHKTIPHTASLRRLLAIVGDLLEQTGAALYKLHLARPLPPRATVMLLSAISSVQEIVRDAHRAVCSRVAGEALDRLCVAVTTMCQITEAVAQSPLPVEQRGAGGTARP